MGKSGDTIRNSTGLGVWGCQMVSSDAGPSRRMPADLIEGALHLREKILSQAGGLLLVEERGLEHLLFSGHEQAHRLDLMLSYAWAKTSLADRAQMVPSR